jgi:signal transduction histidine kinase
VAVSSTADGRPRPLTAPDHPGLLPASLRADSHDGGRHRRSTRDWVIDISCMVVTAGFAALTWFAEFVARPPTPAPLLVADAVIGVLAPMSLWLRRRWPLHLALALVAVSTFAQTVTTPAAIAVATVAVHRRFRTAAAVTALLVGAAMIRFAITAHNPLPYWLLVAVTVLAAAVAATSATFTRAQRQLTRSLADRAHRAEAEQRLRVEQARRAERTRIAREMHDVLAHRISLLSMHAGALEFRERVSPEEVARAAGVIRACAHQALQDLREVVTVLRDGGEEHAPDSPQPGLADLAALVEESRQAGGSVEVDNRCADQAPPPGSVDRAAYRILQETLTNARKHAPGATVRVTVTGEPGADLRIEVRNTMPRAASPTVPGTGTGLVGLAERASLAGGHLAHGPTADGDFRVHASLPWPA